MKQDLIYIPWFYCRKLFGKPTESHNQNVFLRQLSRHSIRNSRVICTIVLIGTYCIIVALAVSLILSNLQVSSRLILCGVGFLYIVTTYLLALAGGYRAVGYLIILFYVSLATGVLWRWGINTPIEVLLFGLVIVLAGILLTARYALFAAFVIGITLVVLQTLITIGLYRPDSTLPGNQSSFGDVFVYCSIFGMLALVSWLYNREMEQSLIQAKKAEAALLQQKANLKKVVKERTKSLRRVQLEEMQQMYRFAELGQLGIILLHDLANQLTALTLEIENLNSKEHTEVIMRTRRILQYMNRTIDDTRGRLNGDTKEQVFDIARRMTEVVAFLHNKAAHTGVTIEWDPPAGVWKYLGDPASLSQVIAITINNAIDAYSGMSVPVKEQRVRVILRRSGKYIVVEVADWGKGISKRAQKHLFKPTSSTKKAGLGLGLYIAKQIINMQFSGSIAVNPRSDYTEFTIKLPEQTT